MTISLKEKLRTLPKAPGCYLMKDSLGRIIYVGKAKVLRSRVSHYLVAPGQLDYKTRKLAAEIYDFDVIITQTEVEALLLERTLIKHHKPRYNILLRDDKEYPYLRVDLHETWPRFTKVRRRREDGATYLGPFGSGHQLRILMDAMYRVFPLIRCSRHEFESAKRPCNYYHMKLCLGPCTLPVDTTAYKAMVKDALSFLAGRNKEVVRAIKDKMADAAGREDYEQAALFRDQLRALEALTTTQAVVVGDVDDADVIGFGQNELKTAFHVLIVRGGSVLATDNFVTGAGTSDREDALTQFLLQYYDGRSVPREILLPFALSDEREVASALLANHPDAAGLQLKIPERGARHDLVVMAGKNAAYQLEEVARLWEKTRTELQVLRDKLHLRRLPERMECIDISNIQGTAIVASDVCFVGGKPAKELYRHYLIKEVVGAPDDFASIREVVRRRLERGLRDDDLPDLLIIDGGKGQLSAAHGVLVDFPAADLELVSLAKSRIDKTRRRTAFIDTSAPERSYERVFFPDREVPLPLSPGTPEYRLLTQIRDEAHRFAITHHRKVRAKVSHNSALTDIPGIGQQLRQRLLTTFGGLDGLSAASLSELRAVKGLRETAAVALYSYFRSNDTDAADTQVAEVDLLPDPLGDVLPDSLETAVGDDGLEDKAFGDEALGDEALGDEALGDEDLGDKLLGDASPIKR